MTFLGWNGLGFFVVVFWVFFFFLFKNKKKTQTKFSQNV